MGFYSILIHLDSKPGTMLMGKVWSFFGLAVLVATVVPSNYASGVGKCFLFKTNVNTHLLKKPGTLLIACNMMDNYFIYGSKSSTEPQAQDQSFEANFCFLSRELFSSCISYLAVLPLLSTVLLFLESARSTPAAASG